MPPYPMGPAPTFGQVKDRLIQDFDCRYKKLEVNIIFEEEEFGDEEIPYIERDTDIGTVQYPAIMTDGERMNPMILRGLCNALKIDPREFGLYLG